MKYAIFQKHIFNKIVLVCCLTENALLVAGTIEQVQPQNKNSPLFKDSQCLISYISCIRLSNGRLEIGSLPLSPVVAKITGPDPGGETFCWRIIFLRGLPRNSGFRLSDSIVLPGADFRI